MKESRATKLPIDVQAFEIMRGENYVYVDKTRHISRMLSEGRNYFLSRPRRFGKSLFVSTLTCLFQGKQELFEGLWIAEHGEWDWQEHPVISLSLNELSSRTPDILEQSINQNLKEIAEHFCCSLHSDILEFRFRELIVELHRTTGMPVVVLIDEYDKPIIDHLGKGQRELEIAKGNRDLLRSFFGVLKGNSVAPILRFVFLTGISRFTKVSIFSELNNLIDLSMKENYVDILGYTQEELETCFQDYIRQLAEKFDWSTAQVIATLARKYNGYRFSNKDQKMYNPFSILNAFSDLDFQDYWFETATPAFLTHLLRQSAKRSLPNGLPGWKMVPGRSKIFWQRERFGWGLPPFPAGPVRRVTLATTDGWWIYAGTKHPDAAWELLKFLISKDFGRAMARTAFLQTFSHEIGFSKRPKSALV